MIPCTKAAHDTRTMFRYGITIFISAFLLFQVQPLFGRLILPWFGGSSATWTTCLLCFQALLLAGYSYAHFSATRLTPRQQRNVHVGLLVLGLIFLPIIPSEAWKPTGLESPALRILGVLVFTVGVPYLTLSTTTPLMQAWFVREMPGVSPYRFYALSNLGSLLGLLSYPFVIEPNLTLRVQAYLWSTLFVVFAGLAMLVRLAGGGTVGCAGPGNGSGGFTASRASRSFRSRTVARAADVWLGDAPGDDERDVAGRRGRPIPLGSATEPLSPVFHHHVRQPSVVLAAAVGRPPADLRCRRIHGDEARRRSPASAPGGRVPAPRFSRPAWCFTASWPG